jgi:hypothetical protein
MNASLWGAGTQLLYVRLAIKRGDWTDLRRRGAEPTPTMKLLFLKGRPKYVAWRKRKDEEEIREAALPKEWFELEPGHWILASSLEKAREIAEILKSPEMKAEEERVRSYPEIDTSRCCPAHGCRDCSTCTRAA